MTFEHFRSLDLMMLSLSVRNTKQTKHFQFKEKIGNCKYKMANFIIIHILL